MPGIARKSVDAAGSTIAVGSSNVFVENAPAARIGDKVNAHGRGAHNNPVMATGSPNVFVNNVPVSRAGDSANCGHVASGSGSVFAN
jgi:uncharacterized Zn-binding protein involved in type VI secretion